jgi:hypothetical protein
MPQYAPFTHDSASSFSSLNSIRREAPSDTQIDIQLHSHGGSYDDMMAARAMDRHQHPHPHAHAHDLAYPPSLTRSPTIATPMPIYPKPAKLTVTVRHRVVPPCSPIPVRLACSRDDCSGYLTSPRAAGENLCPYSPQSRDDVFMAQLNEKFMREKELLAKHQDAPRHYPQDAAFQRFEFKDCIERADSPLSDEDFQDAQAEVVEQPKEQPRAFGRLLNWVFKS